MKLRDIPSVNAILETLPWRGISLPRATVLHVVRKELRRVRGLAKGDQVPLEKHDIMEAVQKAVTRAGDPSLKQIINGTGIVLHTGLGRAPFSKAILRRVIGEMEGYSALEIDLTSGKRGDRTIHISTLLNSLTGAEQSLAVNNNAAAVLLALNTLAEGKEVIISRGQLVEIGGSFRIPDVIEKSGAMLVEVGTTNRTHFHDYVKAVSSRTGGILMVHTSNFRVEGFTKEVPLDQLADLARKRKIPLVVDLGSGALFDLRRVNFPYEPVISEALKKGADLVTFSGDKLLGGPQAGLICGKKRLVSALHKNPLYRAVRCDKVTLSLMEQTLRTYRNIPPERENATYGLLTASRRTLMRRARKVVTSLRKSTVRKLGVRVVETDVEAGSGSLPTEQLESAAIRFDPPSVKPTELATFFRNWERPILGYISGNRFHIDLKTVLPGQLKELSRATEAVAGKVS
ncbi:MAG: L-seryl-tRNA(Sec) selenium transferase [Fidelibacterota bacterium]